MCGGAAQIDVLTTQPFVVADSSLLRLASVKIGINTLSHNLRSYTRLDDYIEISAVLGCPAFSSEGAFFTRCHVKP